MAGKILITEAVTQQESEVCDLKRTLRGLELDHDLKSAKLLLETDWKELNISNAEGRKAYILLELEGNKKTILKVKGLLLEAEYKLKALYRDLEYYNGIKKEGMFNEDVKDKDEYVKPSQYKK